MFGVEMDRWLVSVPLLQLHCTVLHCNAAVSPWCRTGYTARRVSQMGGSGSRKILVVPARNPVEVSFLAVRNLQGLDLNTSGPAHVT